MIKKYLVYAMLTFVLSISFSVSAWADTPSSSGDGSDVGSSDATPVTTTPTTTTNNSTSSAPSPAPDTSPSTTAPDSSPGPTTSTTGTTTPTGDDADTYTYNSATGLWENQYYTWNPTTHQSQPITPQAYSYNPTTGMWDTTQYVYNAPTKTYIPNVISTPTDPQDTMPTTQTNNNAPTTNPESNGTVNTNSTNNATFDLFYNAQISNTDTQNATSGDASVTGNTLGGNALTGDAMDVDNVINLLESSFGLQNAANLLTFTDNINGNVNGNILINPDQINNSSLSVDNSGTQNNVTVNNNGSGSISNNISLGSTSGNATVANNNTGGSAESGSADAVANVVNVLDSAISADKSFLGVININGNLNGNILLPQDFLNQLLASNAPHTTVNVSVSNSNNVTSSSTDTDTIDNNVNLTAATGSANVTDNTNAGSATTGSAGTNLTIFNLTGQQIVAKNSLLVFVNVLGQWVGLIMNAPAGTTAAAVGGGVTEDNPVANNINLNQASSNTLLNKIGVSSISGDATVADNNSGGNATSGSATASANIANIIGDQLSASDWFGLLFINVLGVWHGNFGVNTNTENIASVVTSDSEPTPAVVFGFSPKGNDNAALPSSSIPVILASAAHTTSTTPSDNHHDVVLANSVDSNNGGSSAPTENIISRTSSSQNTWILPLVSFVTVMILTGSLGVSSEFTDKIHARVLSYRFGRN